MSYSDSDEIIFINNVDETELPGYESTILTSDNDYDMRINIEDSLDDEEDETDDETSQSTSDSDDSIHNMQSSQHNTLNLGNKNQMRKLSIQMQLVDLISKNMVTAENYTEAQKTVNKQSRFKAIATGQIAAIRFTKSKTGLPGMTTVNAIPTMGEVQPSVPMVQKQASPKSNTTREGGLTNPGTNPRISHMSMRSVGRMSVLSNNFNPNQRSSNMKSKTTLLSDKMSDSSIINFNNRTSIMAASQGSHLNLAALQGGPGCRRKSVSQNLIEFNQRTRKQSMVPTNPLADLQIYDYSKLSRQSISLRRPSINMQAGGNKRTSVLKQVNSRPNLLGRVASDPEICAAEAGNIILPSIDLRELLQANTYTGAAVDMIGGGAMTLPKLDFGNLSEAASRKTSQCNLGVDNNNTESRKSSRLQRKSFKQGGLASKKQGPTPKHSITRDSKSQRKSRASKSDRASRSHRASNARQSNVRNSNMQGNRYSSLSNRNSNASMLSVEGGGYGNRKSSHLSLNSIASNNSIRSLKFEKSNDKGNENKNFVLTIIIIVMIIFALNPFPNFNDTENWEQWWALHFLKVPSILFLSIMIVVNWPIIRQNLVDWFSYFKFDNKVRGQRDEEKDLQTTITNARHQRIEQQGLSTGWSRGSKQQLPRSRRGSATSITSRTSGKHFQNQVFTNPQHLSKQAKQKTHSPEELVSSHSLLVPQGGLQPNNNKKSKKGKRKGSGGSFRLPSSKRGSPKQSGSRQELGQTLGSVPTNKKKIKKIFRPTLSDAPETNKWQRQT